MLLDHKFIFKPRFANNPYLAALPVVAVAVSSIVAAVVVAVAASVGGTGSAVAGGWRKAAVGSGCCWRV